MSRETLLFRSQMPASAEDLYAWHLRPGAFERLNPPWEKVRILQSSPLTEGSLVTLQAQLGPIPLRWVAQHQNFIPHREFTDIQRSGPFRHWTHRHVFAPTSQHSSWLHDEIQFELPAGQLGQWIMGPSIKKRLDRLFLHRHGVTASDLSRHQSYPAFQQKHWWITGSSGLIGSHLIPFLTTGGHSVTRIFRTIPTSSPSPPTHSTLSVSNASWNPQTGEFQSTDIHHPDVVLHLAGDNIAGGRWTEKRKRRIRDSRVIPTQSLARHLASMPRPPQVWICASAVGIYGDSGDTITDETAAHGDDFLAQVCEEWEQATQPARDAGIRVVHARLGVVLTSAGGALAKMLPAFRAGLGGRIGSGSQFLSWISMEDVLGGLLHLAATEKVTGPVNLTSPQPVRQAEFARTLGHTLHRPTFLPMPAPIVQVLFGEMGQAALLAGTRAEPLALLQSGFTFRHPNLPEALRALLP